MALEIHSYESLKGRFERAHRDRLKLANNTYGALEFVGAPNERIVIRYHSTDIAIMGADAVILDANHWLTSTTKQRLDEIARAYGWALYQHKGAWLLTRLENGRFVDSDKRKVYEFQNGVRIFADGSIYGAGEDQSAQRARIKRQVKKFANDYMTALFNLQVPAPSLGDCFYCAHSATTQDGAPVANFGGSDHLQSHIDESYFVPSLLMRAIDEFAVSIIAKSVLGEIWSAAPNDEQLARWSKEELSANQRAGNIALMQKLGSNVTDIAREQLQKSLARYMARSLGIAV